MKILNVTEGTVYIDDLSMPILYNRELKPTEIEDRKGRRSRDLRWAIGEGLLVDVTNGVPDPLPKPRRQAEASVQKASIPREASKFHQRKAMLSTADPRLPEGTGIPAAQEGASPMNVPEDSNHALGKNRPRSATEEFARDGSMSIVWTGPVSDHGGYAQMNRKFMFGLSDMGANVKYDPVVSMDDIDPATKAKVARLQSAEVPPDAPKVYGMTAPGHYSWDRYKLLFTMMETRRLHKGYVERCNCADEIVVPTNWCRETFLESGVDRPISVVPLGVDTDLYCPGAEPLGFSSRLKDFVFLSVFGWSLRKGYDVLLKAYLEEFTSDEPVSLLISSRYFGSTHETKKQVIRDDIARVSSMVSNPKKPHLLLFGDSLSIDMMPRLYASADCYVLFTRGEGFCLPVIEAAACGLPCIATRYSGQTDFMDDDNSYLVDIDGFQRSEEDLSWISYFYENAEFPILGPSVVEQARMTMRRAYENREEAKRKAGKLREKVVREYNWKKCVSMMHDKLKLTLEGLDEWKCRRKNPS